MDLKVGDSVPVEGVRVYKKTAEEVEEYAGRGGGAKKKKNKGAANPANKENSPAHTTEQEPQKKSKYVPLFTKDGKTNDVITLPGRHPCQCLAVKHALINNCISCGKIVCAQEGSGPCMFCGKLVVTKEEQEVLNRNSRKSEELYKRLAGDSRAQYKDCKSQEESYQKAINSKNKLLEYDVNCEKRTKVIDDESDYFNIDSNKWLTPEQRAALEKKREELQADRHKSRLDRRITFDFAGRKVVEAQDEINYNPEEDDKMMALFKHDQFSVEAEIARRKEGGLVHPGVSADARPLYLEAGQEAEAEGAGKVEGTPSKSRKDGGGRVTAKVQDSVLQEMTDQGICLSMHQPWASLLVMGIKIHEGRNWYSQHRGRLWIHAGSKVPTQQEIDQLQNFYRVHSGVKAHMFPPYYPTSCLLGCVDVTDVLPQEEYRESFPDGESSSPYVFVCRTPQELMVKFPVSGQHKLFKLDPNIHRAAQKSAKITPDQRKTGVIGS